MRLRKNSARPNKGVPLRATLATALVAGSCWLSPATAGDLAFVTSQNGNMVSIIDLSDNGIIAQTALQDAPAPVAYDPRAGRAYVIAADTGRLSVIDEAGRITATRDLGEGAFGIATAPDGGLFVTDWFEAKLTRLSRDLTTLWRVDTGNAPAGVAVSAEGDLVATADRDDNAVSIFDATTGRLLRKIATAGAHPFAVTFHDGRLWTADVQGDVVSVIDPITGKLIGQVPTGSHPYGVAFAGGRGFVTNQYAGTLTVFDAKTLAVQAEIQIGDYPEGIATLPDDSGVVVANWDSDTVEVVDAESLTIRARIDVPAGPRAFGAFTGRQVPQ